MERRHPMWCYRAPVVFGRTYTLTLKQASNKAILAGSLTVTVADLKDTLIDMAVESTDLEQVINSAQLIVNLSLQPLSETVRLSFGTLQPTVPVITIETEEGIEVAKGFALLNGMRTIHTATLGLNTPLAQDTVHKFKIVAWGQSGITVSESFLHHGAASVLSK